MAPIISPSTTIGSPPELVKKPNCTNCRGSPLGSLLSWASRIEVGCRVCSAAGYDKFRRKRRLWRHILRQIESRDRGVSAVDCSARRQILNQRRLRAEHFGERFVSANLVAPSLCQTWRRAAHADRADHLIV